MERQGRILASTDRIVREQLSDLEKKLRENSRELEKLGRDGDMIDDPSLFRLHEEREQLSRLSEELRNGLGGGAVTRESLNGQSKVSIGHKVRVDITYPNNEQEITEVTIGSSFDQRHHTKKSDERIVSDESPLGRSLLDKEVGEETAYQSGHGKGKVKVLGISISPLTEQK